MYASVRRYEGVTNPTEAADRVRKEFVPVLSGIDGFIAYYWIDAGGGVMISTSIFESEAAAEESNRKAADWAKAILPGILPKAPQVTAGTVVAEARGEEAMSTHRGVGREAEATRH